MHPLIVPWVTPALPLVLLDDHVRVLPGLVADAPGTDGADHDQLVVDRRAARSMGREAAGAKRLTAGRAHVGQKIKLLAQLVRAVQTDVHDIPRSLVIVLTRHVRNDPGPLVSQVANFIRFFVFFFPLAHCTMSLARTSRRVLGLRRFALHNESAVLGMNRAFSAMPEADSAHTKAVVAELLTDQEWTDMKQHAIESNKSILLQFTAQWCPPCRAISPVVSALAEQYASSVNFVKADIDNAAISGVVAEHAVSAVPMFVTYAKDGSKRTAFTGADKQALQQAVEALSR